MELLKYDILQDDNFYKTTVYATLHGIMDCSGCALCLVCVHCFTKGIVGSESGNISQLQGQSKGHYVIASSNHRYIHTMTRSI